MKKWGVPIAAYNSNAPKLKKKNSQWRNDEYQLRPTAMLLNKKQADKLNTI